MKLDHYRSLPWLLGAPCITANPESIPPNTLRQPASLGA